jgi:hypothetical protein
MKVKKFKVAIPSRVTAKLLEKIASGKDSDKYSKYGDRIVDHYFAHENQTGVPDGSVRVEYYDAHSVLTAGDLIEKLKGFPKDADIMINSNYGCKLVVSAEYDDKIGKAVLRDRMMCQDKIISEDDFDINNTMVNTLDAIAILGIYKRLNKEIRKIRIMHIDSPDLDEEGVILSKDAWYISSKIDITMLKKYLREMYENAPATNGVKVTIGDVGYIQSMNIISVKFHVSK